MFSSTRPSSVSVTEESSRPPRTIVLCFDGTRGQYTSANTNVVKFFGLLSKDTPEKQVVYYQAGIGTYFEPGVVSPLWTWLAALLDEAFAWYLDAHVMDGYEFLMANYRSGDKVCLFGFSRGAFTARALAGMLHKVGLLTKDNFQQVNFAYKAFQRTDKEGIRLAAGFKKTFSRDVKVDFIGVWDTVQSTGVIVNRILPFTDSNTAIKVFRHALSLDERRARFRPNLYHWPVQAIDPDDIPGLAGVASRKFGAFKSSLKRLFHVFHGKGSKVRPKRTVDSDPSVDSTQRNDGGDEAVSDGTQSRTNSAGEELLMNPDVLEVWFAGCHSDIGGGNVPDNVQVSLSQITLHWMVEQVMQSQCEILFNEAELARIGFAAPPPSRTPEPHTDVPPGVASNIETRQESMDIGGSIVKDIPNKPNPSPANPEAYPEHSDALAPLSDPLERNKLWWLIEIVPTSYEWQDRSGVWHHRWRINLGRPRLIPCENPKFHHTVKERMDYKPLEYKPSAVHDHDIVYV